ncbi:MAG: putative addiction module component (TIGR02574 family) [Mariniblastus sp.]|jgi:putative addiction module component (TIGR02574 family)
MDTQPKQILDITLTLPESDRANLAASLIRSLDATPDPSADAAWATEIERRIRDIDQGPVQFDSWDNVMVSMRERRNG